MATTCYSVLVFLVLISNAYCFHFSDYIPGMDWMVEEVNLELREIDLKDVSLKWLLCLNNCIHNKTGPSKKLSACEDLCAYGSIPLTNDQHLQFAGKATFWGALGCRGMDRAMIFFNKENHVPESGNAGLYAFMIEFNRKYTVYITEYEKVHLINLVPGMLYNIHGLAVLEDNTFERIGGFEFRTFTRETALQTINDIQLTNFHVNGDQLLSNTIMFNRTCNLLCDFQIMWYSPEEDESTLFNETINIHNTEHAYTWIATYKLTSMKFDREYDVAVRSIIDAENYPRESAIHWVTIKTPSCVEWYNWNLTICAPPKPTNLTVSEIYTVDNYTYDIHVEWAKPPHNPELYEIELIDFNPRHGKLLKYSYNISGNSTQFTFVNVELHGFAFQIDLMPFSKGGSSYIFIMEYFKNFSIKTKWEHARVPLLVLLPLLFLVIIMAASLFIYRQRKKTPYLENNNCKYFAKLETSSDFLNEDDTLEELNRLNEMNKINFLLSNVAIDDSMEFNRDNIEILDELGEGAFGLVKMGLVDMEGKGKQKVAIKMLKHSPTMKEIVEFRREIDVMKSVGSHPNIVSIIGHYTKELDELMLLSEFCPNGNLLDYLRKVWNVSNKEKSFHEDGKKTGISNAVENKGYDISIIESLNLNPDDMDLLSDGYSNKEPQKEINLSKHDLLQMAKQIASGMEFLARNKVVHRDLAARNVLVCENNVVKIADFGLSRDIYQYNLYRKKTNGKLPIKWLAIESLTRQIYTTQSDVWSYGILLYEIMTLGCTPYPSIQNENLLDLLKGGYRMEKPANCSVFIFELMLSCWKSQPNQRPTFTSIIEQLNSLIKHEQFDDDDALEMNLPRQPKFILNDDKECVKIKPIPEDGYLIPDGFVL